MCCSVFSVVHDGEWGERGELRVVVTAPESQLLNLSSVSRLVSVLDETDDCGVICKLQEFDRGVFRGAIICVERIAVGKEAP